MRPFFHSASTMSIWLLCVFSGSFVTTLHNSLMDQLAFLQLTIQYDRDKVDEMVLALLSLTQTRDGRA